jgi:competence protein ComEC
MTAKFKFWDVQHGNACFVETPTGKRLIVDCGTGSYIKPTDKTFSPLGYLWHRQGVRRLDAAFITHPHRDHIDDIAYLAAFNPAKVVAPRHLTTQDIAQGNKPEDRDSLAKYQAVLARFPQAIHPLLDDPMVPVNSGMSIQYFQPKALASSNLNNHSLVLVFSYAGSKILVPGDNEEASWSELLKNPTFVEAIRGTNVLLAPHHGRAAGYSAELFRHINPQLIIISDGSASDTSATSRYCDRATGWQVFRRSDQTSSIRKCVTTRSDDFITVTLGFNSKSNKNYLHVTVD